MNNEKLAGLTRYSGTTIANSYVLESEEFFLASKVESLLAATTSTERAAPPIEASASPVPRAQGGNTCENESWNPDEQAAFSAWAINAFPNESSQGLISLGSAWKQGQAYALRVGGPSPADAGGLTPERINWIARNCYGSGATEQEIEFAKAIAREVLATKAAQPEEPVACRYKGNGGEWVIGHIVDKEKAAAYGCEFLYTSPFASPAPSAKPDMADAYVGAREDLAIWQRRALEAEESCRRLTAVLNAENGPTFMGEPVAAPSASASPAAPLDPIRSIFFTDASGCRVLLNIARAYPTVSGIEIEVQAPIATSPAAAVAAPAPAPVAGSQHVPDAWMKSDTEECTSAASKKWMEQAGFGVWDQVAAMYTRPLFFAAAAPAVPVPVEPERLRDEGSFLTMARARGHTDFSLTISGNYHNPVVQALFERYEMEAAPSLQQGKEGSQP